MKKGASYLALRKTRSFFEVPRFRYGFLAVSVILGLAGPFGLINFVPVQIRLIYWLFLGPLTFALGCYLGFLAGYGVPGKWLRGHVRNAAVALLPAIAVKAFVLAVNWTMLGFVPRYPRTVYNVAIPTAVVTMIMALTIFHLGNPWLLRDRTAPLTPPLLDRLEIHKRGPLVSLSVQDHYTEVVTTKGSSMLLMLLSDAIRETPPARGLQVHRSHWVALDQVKKASRDGERALLTLSDNRKIPVSRTYVGALKEAGILAK